LICLHGISFPEGWKVKEEVLSKFRIGSVFLEYWDIVLAEKNSALIKI
jgi:hypothetical protein